MPDFSLVPVDHQPDFSDVSLVPVDHDPFSADRATQQAQIQSAQNQPESTPQQPATGPDLSDVGAPLIGDGGQFSPGVPWANKAADIASKLVENTSRGAVNLVATPGAIMQPNPYPPGSEEAFWYEDQRQQLINKAAPAIAFAMLGAGTPIAARGAVGALGGKPPRLGAAESSKILPEEFAGQTRSQIPDLAADKGLVPGAKGVGRGFAEELHHAWPKYLGGAVKQELVSLPKSLHDKFHRGLDEKLPKWRGRTYYENLGPTERQQALQHLAAYTKNFDAEHGTKLYDALLKNGFPVP